jgi:hypothetical protein
MNNIIEFKIDLTSDITFSGYLKYFYPVYVPKLLGDAQQFLIYVRFPKKEYNACYILITENNELLEIIKTKINSYKVLGEVPNDLEEYELIYGLKSGVEVGRYNC